MKYKKRLWEKRNILRLIELLALFFQDPQLTQLHLFAISD